MTQLLIYVEHQSVHSGGATRLAGKPPHHNELDAVNPAQPREAISELAAWCEKWGLPATAHALLRQVAEHEVALAKREGELIAQLHTIHGRREQIGATK